LNGYPTGIPMQISKKWDEVSTRQVYEAGYDYGAASATHPQWWTMNYLLRIPANSKFSGVVAVIYNEYGNVASFSAAQLSLIGYTDTWTWLQQSLGSLGENICFDILGIHARASTTGVPFLTILCCGQHTFLFVSRCVLYRCSSSSLRRRLERKHWRRRYLYNEACLRNLLHLNSKKIISFLSRKR